jgi:hypothetical protein
MHQNNKSVHMNMGLSELQPSFPFRNFQCDVQHSLLSLCVLYGNFTAVFRMHIWKLPLRKALWVETPGLITVGICTPTEESWSRGSSGSIVSDYGLDDRCSIPDRGRGFFILPPTSRPALGPTKPASCTMGTGGPFPGGKARPGRDADQTPSSSAEAKNE